MRCWWTPFFTVAGVLGVAAGVACEPRAYSCDGDQDCAATHACTAQGTCAQRCAGGADCLSTEVCTPQGWCEAAPALGASSGALVTSSSADGSTSRPVGSSSVMATGSSGSGGASSLVLGNSSSAPPVPSSSRAMPPSSAGMSSVGATSAPAPSSSSQGRSSSAGPGACVLTLCPEWLPVCSADGTCLCPDNDMCMNGAGQCFQGRCRWTVTRSVAADGDDGFEDNDGEVILDNSQDELVSNNQWAAFRFPALGVPVGSTIHTAVLTLQDVGDRRPSVLMYVEPTPYPTQFSGADFDISRRITGALFAVPNVAWKAENDLPTSSGSFSSPDMGALIQGALDNRTLPMDSPVHVLLQCVDRTSNTDIDVSFRDDGGMNPTLSVVVSGPAQ